MKKIKSLLSSVLALTIGVTTTFGLVACGGGEDTPPHTHTFGEWTLSSAAQNCEGGVFERICSICDHVEERTGTADDHVWGVEYVYDTRDHWLICGVCNQPQSQSHHTDKGNGVCGTCEKFIPTSGVTYELSSDGTYVIITGYDEMETNTVVIAPMYEGVPVKEIAPSAFEDCVNLATISLPDGIRSIGESAFSGCTQLMGIYLWETVESIGDNAFAGCANLAIFCEAEEQPEGWSENWNPLKCPRYWGHQENGVPGASVKASKILDAIVVETQTKGQIKRNGNLDGEKVPDGFSSITRFDTIMEGTTQPWLTSCLSAYNFDKTDLKDYEEIWTAVKVKNAFWSFVDAKIANGLAELWVYIHMKQVGADESGFLLWDIEFSVGGQVYAVFKNQSGRKLDDEKSANSFAAMFWDEGYSSLDGNAFLLYRLNQEELATVSIYCTEVLGIRKSEY